jgi:hypothetical protein
LVYLPFEIVMVRFRASQTFEKVSSFHLLVPCKRFFKWE